MCITLLRPRRPPTAAADRDLQPRTAGLEGVRATLGAAEGAAGASVGHAALQRGQKSERRPG